MIGAPPELGSGFRYFALLWTEVKTSTYSWISFGGHLNWVHSYLTTGPIFGGQVNYSGCAYHARQGNTVCANRPYLPLEAIEQELLGILVNAVITPATTDRLLARVNARLRPQATSRPRLQEIKAAVARVDREIANYTRVVARGDFASLEGALKAAEARRATLLAELEHLEQGWAPGVTQLTPAALERHLQGLVQELRSGVQGKVREAIERTVGKITVDADGSRTIEAMPDGLLGLEGRFAPLGPDP